MFLLLSEGGGTMAGLTLWAVNAYMHVFDSSYLADEYLQQPTNILFSYASVSMF